MAEVRFVVCLLLLLLLQSLCFRVEKKSDVVEIEELLLDLNAATNL